MHYYDPLPPSSAANLVDVRVLRSGGTLCQVSALEESVRFVLKTLRMQWLRARRRFTLFK